MKFFKKILRDRATLSAFLDKGLVSFKGPVVIWAVLYFLDVDQQGLWYTFISLSALAGLAELGFTTIISQFVSHEYANLHFQRGLLTGNRRSLDKAIGLVRYAIKVYCCIVPIAILIMLMVGAYFYSNETYEILTIWSIYCVVSGLNLISSLFHSIYRGFDKVYQVHMIKFFSNLVSIFILVLSLYLGFGIASLPLSMMFLLIVSIFGVFNIDRKFWFQLLKHKIRYNHSWFKEVVSIQSKYAVSFFCGYFMFNLFVPLSFKHQGSMVSGQLGLTLTIAKTISTISYTWIDSKLPTLNMMASKRDRVAFKTLFYSKAKYSLSTFVVGAFFLLGIVFLANQYEYYQDRVLSVEEMALVLGSELATVFMSICAIYVRAHKIEPFYVVSMISALFVSIIATYFITTSNIFNLYIAMNAFNWLVMLPMFFFVANAGMKKLYQSS
ncbi:hypothetical protein AB4251_09235 [Vibrio lentus]|uniref:Polysaccharide biosynthesis protein n=1 Tax=Vibrio lentus TaxID=136468 RepID=A0AB36XLH0_9VIBR|nr:hypothetical protein [Vibrio lentus]MCC4837789.1 hypothetical protein [Vibrio lentus]PMI15668.1 hypothetical protein BCU51_17045 [Vibrio lentus]PMK31419.1 hypothetical protein BCU02_02060 [Vibrio lentus]PMK46311.1 hypothetical protein BCT99_20220 [Vibrio lentus]PML34063.1 hypothetical protein BCT79_10745 [Vibrio lentus]